MTTFVAMLRGVNVAGHGRLPMAELRRLLDSLGFRNVRTYIQSGNVVFEHTAGSVPRLQDKIEKGINSAFNLSVRVLIRRKEEMLKVIENFPFKVQEQEKAHVTFLAAIPGSIPEEEIETVRNKGEKFVVSGREVYLYCPNGYGRSKLSNTFLEKKLKVSATTRNWRTVKVLHDMMNS